MFVLRSFSNLLWSNFSSHQTIANNNNFSFQNIAKGCESRTNTFFLIAGLKLLVCPHPGLTNFKTRSNCFQLLQHILSKKEATITYTASKKPKQITYQLSIKEASPNQTIIFMFLSTSITICQGVHIQTKAVALVSQQKRT